MSRLAFTRLQKAAHPSQKWTDFAAKIDLNMDGVDPEEINLRALCVGQLVRLYWPELPLDVNRAVTAISVALPTLAAHMPKKCSGLLQTLQWHNVLAAVQDDTAAADWLSACQQVARDEANAPLVPGLLPLAAAAVSNCHINTFLELNLKCPEFGAKVAVLVENLKDRVRNYFESSLNCGGSIVEDARLYADLATAAPTVLAGYVFPISGHHDWKVRQLAARALASLSPQSEEWQRLAIDREAAVRLEWAECAAELGARRQRQAGVERLWSKLCCDSSAEVRAIALRHASSDELVPLLRHKQHGVTLSVLQALVDLDETSVVEYEAVIRLLAREQPHFVENLQVARPILQHYRFALELQGKSRAALESVFNQTLMCEAAAHTLETGTERQRQAILKWARHRLGLSEVEQLLDVARTPLFDVEWLLQTPEAVHLLEQVAKMAPHLLNGHLPRITPTTEAHVLRAIALFCRKLPYKLVNPMTSVLVDMCQDSPNRYEAAQILHAGAPSLFEDMAPEILDAALEANDYRVLLLVAKFVPVLPRLDRLEPLSASIYGALCPAGELAEWLEELLPVLESAAASALLVELVDRSDLPVACFPLIVKFMDGAVLRRVAQRVSHDRVFRLAPLLCFGELGNSLKLAPLAPAQVYSAFCRLVFIGSTLSSSQKPLRTFCELFVSSETIASLILLCRRLYSFELHVPVQGYYEYLEETTRVLEKFKRQNSWGGAGKPVDVSGDCFRPARRRVPAVLEVPQVPQVPQASEQLEVPQSEQPKPASKRVRV